MNKADLIRVEYAAEKARNKETVEEKKKLLKDRRSFYLWSSASAIAIIAVLVSMALVIKEYNPTIYP